MKAKILLHIGGRSGFEAWQMLATNVIRAQKMLATKPSCTSVSHETYRAPVLATKPIVHQCLGLSRLKLVKTIEPLKTEAR